MKRAASTDPATFNPIGKWDHDNAPAQFGLANSYLIAAGFLDGLPVVEDWGCGSAYARRFFQRSRYIGVDGSGSRNCDIMDDLRTRSSRPDGILLRHVLEHNPQWPVLLANALACFKRRMALVLYLPPEATTRIEPDPTVGVPSIWIGKDIFLPMIEPLAPLQITTPGDCETTYLFNKPR